MTARLACALAGCVLAVTACGAGTPPAAPTSQPRAASGSASASPRPAGTPPTLHVALAPYRLPEPIAREAVVDDGRWATVAGGLVGSDGSTATAYRIDLGRGIARHLPDLAVPVHDTAGARLGAETIVVGGGNAAEQDGVQTRTGGSWQLAGHLPQARSDLSVVAADGRLIALGGYDGTATAESAILASTDGSSWRTIGQLPLPVRYAATTVLGGSVWVFGGERAGVMQTAVQRVDPATGRAHIVARLPRPLGHAAAIPFGDRILLAGGRPTGDTVTARMWWFDPASGRVSSAGRLPLPLADSAVATWGGRAFLLGGETPAPTDRVVELRYGR